MRQCKFLAVRLASILHVYIETTDNRYASYTLHNCLYIWCCMWQVSPKALTCQHCNWEELATLAIMLKGHNSKFQISSHGLWPTLVHLTIRLDPYTLL